MFPEISWPRSPLLVVLDAKRRTVTRYRGRHKVGRWEWEAGADEWTLEGVENVRTKGVETTKEGV